MCFRICFILLFFFCSTTLFGQEASYREVEAEAGEGVYTLLRRHGLEPAVYFQSFLELNQGQLGAGNSLQLGKAYRLPAGAMPAAEGIADSLVLADADTLSLTPEAPAAILPDTGQPSRQDTGGPAANEEPPAEETKVIRPAAPKAKEEKVAAVLDVPLFGKKYAKVEVKDQQLKGAVYYLVAGHGGPDPGAIGKYGPYSLSEDEYAYDVTIRLARRLMEHGATVHMIIQDANDGIRDENILPHDTDEICYPNEPVPYRQNERLRQRTYAVNNLFLKHKGAYQRMLAIHVDSRSVGQNIDVFFYHHENSPSGKKLAEHIHQTITSKYSRHQPNRDYSGNVSTRSSLFVIKYSHPPAVFVELGNIRNDRDQRRFVLPDNRQALANWMCEGIIADYKAEKK